MTATTRTTADTASTATAAPTDARGDAPLPNALPRPPDEQAQLRAAWATPRGWRIVSSVQNNDIGLFYVFVAMLFLVLAGSLALLMRLQLAVPENTLLSENTYNQMFTMHGTVMMFLFAVPVVEAIAVYLLPGMTGARDLPFPRLGAYAFWAYAVGGLVFFGTIFFGVAPDGGWFMYPPLTGKEHSPGPGADWWLLGIGFIEISAIAGAIEIVIGVLFTRAPGMSLGRMPVYAWAMLVTALMILFAFPAIIAGSTLLELERALDWPFFIAARGGDPLLWQHLFWFFGHPEVYIIFLPAAGMVSMMVPVVARTPLVGYRAVVVALVGVGFFSFALWAHHMFTAGLGLLSMAFISAASMAVAIPSGIQVFAWIATLWKGRMRINSVSLFLCGFLFIFVLGGLTGVMVAVQPFDTQVHDTYFIVAHLHYVLIGGMLFPVFAALYHWGPLVNGHRFSERLAKWTFGLMFGGFNLAFFPMHISGLLGMPRRVASYASDPALNLLNMLSTVGAFVFAAGIALFLVDAARTWARPKQAHGDPWQAPTLEWLPGEGFGTRSIPQVESHDPLWQRPSLAAEVAAGRHWLPGTSSGGREALITSPLRAQPSHLLLLPGDSWRPFIAALGTAGFFLLLTAEFHVLAALCGVTAIVAIIMWLWQTDPLPHAPTVAIGDGVRVPVGAQGTASHAWWAMVLLLGVDATVFASFLFSHVHVSLRAEVCPPPGAELPALGWTLLAGVLWVAASLAIDRVRRTLPGRAGLSALVVAAAACSSAAFAAMLLGHATLRPTVDAWSATIAALLAYQGLHAVLLLLMGGYLIARSLSGRLQPQARGTLDCIALMWHGAGVQALVIMAVVQLLPGWMKP
jgi:cytochrome c oxidase subunit I+III